MANGKQGIDQDQRKKEANKNQQQGGNQSREGQQRGSDKDTGKNSQLSSTSESADDKKRRDSRTGSRRGDSEPHIPDADLADLEDDQADSGPDRDHNELER
jgi:hypothetical protein